VVERQHGNTLKVVGSNPSPLTTRKERRQHDRNTSSRI
jgi:hypothetical protein